MILNLFFVIVCKLDIVGVALASALSQCRSAFLIVMALFRSHEDFGLHLAKLRLSKDKAQAILRLGIPSGFRMRSSGSQICLFSSASILSVP